MPEQGESSPRKTWGPQRLPGTDVPVIQQDPIPHIRPLVAKPEERSILEPSIQARKFIPFGTPAIVNGQRVRILQDIGYETDGAFEIVLDESGEPKVVRLGQRKPLSFIQVKLPHTSTLVAQRLNDAQLRSLIRSTSYANDRKARKPLVSLNENDYKTLTLVPNAQGEIIILTRPNFIANRKP